MNREIKFRAWDKKLEEMVKVEALCLEENILITSKKCVVDESNDVHLLKNIELMQYTGLKDINGKEIYEGDIIKFDYHGKKVCSTIEYSMGVYGVLIEVEYDTDFWTTTDLIGYVGQEFEVIGNIYYNPELLNS